MEKKRRDKLRDLRQAYFKRVGNRRVADVLTAMSIHETGWLKSAPGNNFSGIKLPIGTTSGGTLSQTKEKFRSEKHKKQLIKEAKSRGGKFVKDDPDELDTIIIVDRFRDFKSIDDFVNYKVDLLEGKLSSKDLKMAGIRYRSAYIGLQNNGDVSEFIEGLKPIYKKNGSVAIPGYYTAKFEDYRDSVKGSLYGPTWSKTFKTRTLDELENDLSGLTNYATKLYGRIEKKGKKIISNILNDKPKPQKNKPISQATMIGGQPQGETKKNSLLQK